MIWIALMLAGATPPSDNFGKPFAAWVPRDVRLFVIDAQACVHFSGEYGFDSERKAFLDRMIKENCTDLDSRKGRLIRKYQQSTRARKLVSEVWSQ